jgi:hypothetical protein
LSENKKPDASIGLFQLKRSIDLRMDREGVNPGGYDASIPVVITAESTDLRYHRCSSSPELQLVLVHQ